MKAPGRRERLTSPLQPQRVRHTAIGLHQQVSQISWKVEPSPLSINLRPRSQQYPTSEHRVELVASAWMQCGIVRRAVVRVSGVVQNLEPAQRDLAPAT